MSKILGYIKEYKPTLKAFSENLVKDGLPIIGLNVPECREIAKILAKEDYKELLSEVAQFHEQQLIKGLIIGYLKIPFSEVILLLKDFVLEVDNWAVCDSTISTLKIFKKNKQTEH